MLKSMIPKSDHAQNRLKRNTVRFNFALANRRKAKELGDGNG
jgi:hypothetical protein